MGVFDCFKHGSLLLKFVLGLLVLASVFVWVAFISTEWIHTGAGRYHGLWLACYDLREITKCQTEYGGPYWDRWAVVQALATFGFVGTNAALVMSIVYMYAGRLKHSEDLAALIAFICIGTGLLYMFGMLVIMVYFTSEYVIDFTDHSIWIKPKPGYCYYLSWTTVWMNFLTSSLILKDVANRRRLLRNLARSQWMELQNT